MIRPSVKIGELCTISDDAWIGENTVVKNYVEIRENVVIGKDCYIDSLVCFTGDANIGDRVTIRNQGVIARGVEIGNDTFIAPQVMFQNLDFEGKKVGGAKIGANCKIGTNVTFKEGVSVCDNVIIGSKSYVNKNIFDPGTYAGIPARRIK